MPYLQLPESLGGTDKFKTPWWQKRLGERFGAGQIGDVVTDIEDIDQCIATIVRTRKGSVPHRPEFGVDLTRYIDRPIPEVVPLIIRDTWKQINKYEPRVIVEFVEAEMEPEVLANGHFNVHVQYRLKDEEIHNVLTIEVPFTPEEFYVPKFPETLPPAISSVLIGN